MPFTIAPPGDAHDFCKVNLRLHAAKIGATNDKRKKLLSLTITTNQNVKLSVMDYLGMETDNKADITLWGVNKISGKASGDLFFSYSPDSKQYHLNKQIVYLGSEKNSLEINIILDNGIRELNINGMVNEASISKMNLFPTFWGWYRDNIYLTPLTLLTTIFGGVTLMINNKKKNS